MNAAVQQRPFRFNSKRQLTAPAFSFIMLNMLQRDIPEKKLNFFSKTTRQRVVKYCMFNTPPPDFFENIRHIYCVALPKMYILVHFWQRVCYNKLEVQKQTEKLFNNMRYSYYIIINKLILSISEKSIDKRRTKQYRTPRYSNIGVSDCIRSECPTT